MSTCRWHNMFKVFVFFMLLSSAGLQENCVPLSYQGLSLFPYKDAHNNHYMIAFCFQIKVWEGMCICRALVLLNFYLAPVFSCV